MVANLLQTKQNQSNIEANKEKFFACSPQDMQLYADEKARNQPVNPPTLIKQQFVMSKSEAIQRKIIVSYISFYSI